MDIVVERSAALDVHKAQVTACVRVPDGPRGGRREEIETLPPRCRGLLALGDWLERPWCAACGDGGHRRVLEAGVGGARGPFALMLVNARHGKQVPGRKTDVSDAQWLCRLVEAGLLRPSGVSGRAMLDALVAGTTDAEVLADLAKGRLRQKLPALRDALQGRFDAHHALLAPTARASGLPRRVDADPLSGDRGPDRPFRPSG
jgi:transposase